VAAIDTVYTWVDGTWPGFDALLRQHAGDAHDLNPNRYRDNVDILKYNLRSLHRFAPWIGRVFLVTCRPQAPAWLDSAAVRLVHHDEFMPTSDVPSTSKTIDSSDRRSTRRTFSMTKDGRGCSSPREQRDRRVIVTTRASARGIVRLRTRTIFSTSGMA
jgi:hypothetical protein